MSTFDERENAYETKFAHDAETQFKIEARRNKKLAIWAAEKLGVSAYDYTRELIKADLEEQGAEDVISKLISDLEGKVGEEGIREKLAQFQNEAQKEITQS